MISPLVFLLLQFHFEPKVDDAVRAEPLTRVWKIPIFSLAIHWDKMEDSYKDRTSLMKGAKDIAREVKKQTVKKVNEAVDRAQDEYTQRSYSRFQDEEEDDDYYPPGETYDGEANDDEGSSEATEGHDEDDEIDLCLGHIVIKLLKAKKLKGKS